MSFQSYGALYLSQCHHFPLLNLLCLFSPRSKLFNQYIFSIPFLMCPCLFLLSSFFHLFFLLSFFHLVGAVPIDWWLKDYRGFATAALGCVSGSPALLHRVQYILYKHTARDTLHFVWRQGEANSLSQTLNYRLSVKIRTQTYFNVCDVYLTSKKHCNILITTSDHIASSFF